MITEKRKRRKASEDDGKEIMPRIKNEQVLGGNTITNEVVKETSSKSHTDQTIHAPTDRTTLNHTSQSQSMFSKSDEEDDYHLTLDNDVENNSNVLSRTFTDTSTSKPKTVVMITIADKNNTDRIMSHNGESSNCDGSMTKYGPIMDYAKKYEIVLKDYDNARNNNTSGAGGSHCSKNIDSNPLNSDNISQGLDQNIGSDLKMKKYNEASSCYDNNTKIVHIYEATKLENIFHDAGTGVEMIGIDVANITSAKKDEIKVDTSREIYLTIDLENKNNHIEGTIFVTPPFTKENDIRGNIFNALDDLKREFNNEIISNSETKFETNTMTVLAHTCINTSDYLKGVSKDSTVQHINAKEGTTITKEERSQRYTRSRSRPTSLQKIDSSSQQLQKQQHQQQQRSHDILKEPSSSSRYNNNASSKINNNDRIRNHSRSTSPTRRPPINLIPTRSSVTTKNRGGRRSRSSSINSSSSTKRNSRSPITNIAANTRFNPKSKSRTSRSTSHSCSRSFISQSRSTSRSTNHRSVNNHHHNRRQPHHSRPRPNSHSHSRSPVPPTHHHHYHIHPPSDSNKNKYCRVGTKS